MQIDLSPEVATALVREAERQGRTPDDVGSEIIRRALAVAADIEPGESTEGGSLFDFLGDFIGCLHSGSGDPESLRLSEDTGEKFTALLVQDQRRIERERMETTMAQFLEGYIGVFDSRDDQPGGARMSDDTGRKFAEGMMRKRQQGHL
ncbi:MAG: hypothetical protein JO306_05215 [Gemmatimonadetes bacterium]|nr:hypothetical protein [Gemmatimonadota bacterium]